MKKIIAWISPVVLPLLILEFFFRLAGVPQAGSRFVETIAWRNHLKAHKSPAEVRIFAYGESTFVGAHYAPISSPVKWLGEYLNEYLPEKEIRVVNFARMGRGSNFALRTFRDTLDYHPDYAVFYVGHNDFLPGERLSDSAELNQSKKLYWGNLAAQSRLISFLYRTVIRFSIARREARDRDRMGAIHIEDPVHELNMGAAIPSNDPAYQENLKFSERNLRSIMALAQNKKIPILFVLPTSNLKDFEPLASRHLKNLTPQENKLWKTFFEQGDALAKDGDFIRAKEAYEKAFAVDSTFALLNYRLGKLSFSEGDLAKAKNYFEAARDRDAMPCRANRDMLKLIDRLTHEFNVPIVDSEKAILPETLGGIPGEPVIEDNVHFSIAGQARVGKAMALAFADQGWIAPKLSWKFSLERAMDEIAKGFGVTHDLQVKSLVNVSLYLGDRFEDRIRTAKRAVEISSENSDALRNLAWTYWSAGRQTDALLVYKTLKKQYPEIFKEVMTRLPDVQKAFESEIIPLSEVGRLGIPQAQSVPS